jgi:hypothetical protein
MEKVLGAGEQGCEGRGADHQVKTRRKSIPGPYEGLMLEEENKVRKN